ncbi:beta-lactamase family protein [Nocardia sp. CDC159]|uniref:Beta-lactamase family protein n=1 Tax=Nocardia pulmonis TaxID=2951408 RepID=A0A9X2EEC6_9NOCA|nr:MULTISPECIES: serine hydrolase domain-containing protein [Nocardia]MCM6778894.1 beta-lactamase family protein [Nocardia pulmonis]MCM6791783.1 beta-lactamase family protein [Nocardia sp. CDC159]
MVRKGFRRAAAGVAAAAVLAGSVAACDSATATGDSATAPGLARVLEDIVRGGYPGAQVVVTEHGQDRIESAGVGDLASGERFRDGDHVRIGSNTKTFVAAVLAQLVSEGQVELDAPVERYLPGVVAGNGNDGAKVTVRNLLQHTSGLPDYLASGNPEHRERPEPAQLQADSETVRWRHYEPAELVARAMTMPPQFEPDTKSVYTNTNYILLGMLIERVTGRPVAAEVERRIIAPLGLRDTYFPAARETGLRDPHPRGYHERDGERIDFTDMDTSWAGAAGAMVSTGSDLNRFFTALLDGKIVPAAQLAEMQKTVPWDRDAGGYGLALIDIPVSCGKKVWGHGGSIMGFETRTGVTADGRAVTLTVNQLARNQQDYDVVTKAFDTAICEARR